MDAFYINSGKVGLDDSGVFPGIKGMLVIETKAIEKGFVGAGHNIGCYGFVFESAGENVIFVINP